MALTKITPQMFDTSATAHDLNVDNGTLVVDGSASRVGIGTATPSTLLHVDGTATATTFVGALTGNVTGNVSGTAATVTGAAQTNITSLGTLTALTVDDITINGSTISDAGDLTVDVGGDIILDAGGNEIKLKTGGTEWGQIYNSSSDLAIYSAVQDKDIKLQGNDGGSVITAMTIDMSEGGNVGIGRLPSERLDVDGIIQINRTGDHPAIRFLEGGTTRGYIGSADWAVTGGGTADFGISSGSSGNLLLGTNAGVERMRIFSDGSARISKGGTGFTPLQYDGLVVQNGDATGIRIIDAGNGGSNGGHTGLGNDNGNLRVMTAGTMVFATGLSPTDQLYQGGDERMRITSGGHVRVNPGTTDYNGHSNVDQYLFTAQTSWNATGDQSLNIVNHNGNWLDGTTGGDTAYGLMWGYGNHVRGGVHYDHRGTEKFDIYSSYAPIRLRTPNTVSGNISPIGSETTMPAGLEVNVGGSVTMAKQPTAVYTHSAASEAGAYAYNWTSAGANELICKPQLAVVNVGSIYTPSNGRFTAPVAGIYRYAVHGNLYTNGLASTAFFAVRIRKGTGHYLMHYESNATRNANGWVYMNAAGLISLAANEYITFSLETNSIASAGTYKLGWDLSSYTHYEFHKIS